MHECSKCEGYRVSMVLEIEQRYIKRNTVIAYRPKNALAEQFLKLLGQKCLTQRDIDMIRVMGYEIIVTDDLAKAYRRTTNKRLK